MPAFKTLRKNFAGPWYSLPCTVAFAAPSLPGQKAMKFACLIGFFSMFTSLAAHELLHGGGFANFDEALAAGGVDDVRRFVNPASLNSTGLMGRTPLEMAVWSGNLQVTHYLLDRGANPNVRDTYGLTPLNYAAMRGQLEMTRLLVDRGAEVNLAGADGRTSLSDALAELCRVKISAATVIALALGLSLSAVATGGRRGLTERGHRHRSEKQSGGQKANFFHRRHCMAPFKKSCRDHDTPTAHTGAERFMLNVRLQRHQPVSVLPIGKLADIS